MYFLSLSDHLTIRFEYDSLFFSTRNSFFFGRYRSIWFFSWYGTWFELNQGVLIGYEGHLFDHCLRFMPNKVDFACSEWRFNDKEEIFQFIYHFFCDCKHTGRLRHALHCLYYHFILLKRLLYDTIHMLLLVPNVRLWSLSSKRMVLICFVDCVSNNYCSVWNVNLWPIIWD